MPVTLRDHQVEAVDAIVRGLDIPPGKRVPVNGIRATVVAACGTGKTIIAASAAARIAHAGRILVLVPTLDLLTQTVRAWREAGHTGPAVAVCSLEDDPSLWSMDVRSTTNPIRLALWHADGPVVIFGTYASLPVLGEAFAGAYGMRLAPVDLAVVDEAHRTSGSLGKAWADIHDQAVIPAVRRLYLTATPRIWQPRPDAWEVREGLRDRLPEEMAASMDDQRIFGPVVYQLSLADAISRGLLARYQIIVVELRDPVVTPEQLRGDERHEERVRGLRLGALQTAMLRTAVEHKLQTMITFHHRTIEAEAFATGLPAVAARLHAEDPERYPAAPWAEWLMGAHPAEHRQQILGEFGGRAGLAILCNCRVLGEGVDIRAVDSVALLDPKGAPHDIVQAIGRALRQKPGEGKMASLIVPVFLKDGEDPEDMFTSGSYRPLVNVLQGLRAHDENAVEMLAIPQTAQSRVVKPSSSLGDAPDEGEEENRLLLRFSSPRDPRAVADFVSFQVIDTERRNWVAGFTAARRYREREGDLLVPYSHTEAGYPLGRWISQQRREYGAGRMNGARARRLEELGMVWDAGDHTWQENLAAARVYYEMNGTLAAPRSASALDRPIGQWLSNLRRPGALDDNPDRAAALAAIDPDWRPAWPIEWQRSYAGVRECVAGGAAVGDLLPGVTVHGEDVGAWLEMQRQHVVWHGLSDGQRERLAALGVEPLPEPVAITPVEAAPEALSGAFGRGVRALRQYRDREGSVTVSRAHVEALEDGTKVKLGVWLANTKSRRERLAPEQVAALIALGVELPPMSTASKSAEAVSAFPAAFQRGLDALRRYRHREGSVTVSRAHVEALEDGSKVKLGVWLANTKSRRAGLGEAQLAALAELGLEWAR